MPLGYVNSTTDPEVRNLWKTPKPVFDWLDNIYHFDVDLAASDNWLGLPYISPEQNSLVTSWLEYGKTGFLNPPYSNIGPWFNKAILEAEQGFRSVHLVPTPNGEASYRTLENFTCHSMTFIHGRLGFIHPVTLKPVIGNFRGSCVIVFGPWERGGLVHVNFISRDRILNGLIGKVLL